MIPRPIRALFVLAVIVAAGNVAAATEGESPLRRVQLRVAQHKTVEGQTRELAEIAWLDEPRDPAMAFHAREILVGYGKEALGALGSIVVEADKIYSADIQVAFIYARLKITDSRPGELLGVAESIFWFGSVDAKRLAIPFLAEARYRPALLAMADATYEHAELIPAVVEALPDFREDRARFFLGDLLLNTERLEDKRAAARALVRIGGRCIDTLREGMLAESPEVRKLSVEALLPYTGVDSLTALYEFMMEHPDDDPALLDRVRQRAEQLESLLEQQGEYDAGGIHD